jgi:hypothetical protein
MRSRQRPAQADAMTTSMHTRLAAVGLASGPLLFTLGDLLRRLVEPSGTPSAGAITAAVHEHGGVWLVAGLLSVTAAFCVVPGVWGLLAAAGGRGARTTVVGALLVGAGALALVGHTVAFYAPYALYARAHTPVDDLTAVDRASESYPLLIALIVVFIVGMAIGPVVLLVGLRRARRVPVWAVVAAVVFAVSGSGGGVGLGMLGIGAAAAAFLPAARSLLVTGTAREEQGTPADGRGGLVAEAT